MRGAVRRGQGDRGVRGLVVFTQRHGMEEHSGTLKRLERISSPVVQLDPTAEEHLHGPHLLTTDDNDNG